MPLPGRFHSPNYTRTALLPLIPASVVAGIAAVALVNRPPRPEGGDRRGRSGAVVVVLSWITMVLLLFRIEPEFRAGGEALSP